ncbi:MAG: DUF3857 domain-containing protein [Bacteroidetes bacterium]|nr:DUF3857 domain-containing protein [Bacteroidota bacterium]
MRILLITLYLALPAFIVAQTSNYEAAWQSLNKNDRKKAQEYLTAAIAEGKNAQDAYITNLYLSDYNSSTNTITDFGDAFYGKYDNTYPYIYSLWFNEAVAGTYGKKKPYQLALLNKLLTDDKAPGTIVGGANYQMGMNAIYSNEIDKSGAYYDKINNIRNWQYVGPFENLSKSGYFKSYGPLEKPEGDAVFKSLSNADVKWFTPATEIKDGWTPAIYQFNRGTAVIYAQSFVSSASDQTVYCNVGFSGSIKVWINDEQVLGESEERVTEMDGYTVKVNLKKGTNRVLVQLGFSRLDYPNFNIRFTDERNRPLPDIKGSATYAPYPKVTAPQKYTVLPHFAEAFFANKISKEPENLVNYLLLTDAYIRSKKIKEARETITAALAKAKDNSLLRSKLLEVLIKENNRTLMLEEVEEIKKADPESLMVLELKIKELFEAEKYEEVAEVLQKRVALYGEDETTSAYDILLLVKEKKFDSLVTEAERMFKKYPANPKLLTMMYTIKKEVYKDQKGALKVYEDFLKSNYDYSVSTEYADALSDMGNTKKALDIRQKLADNFPYDPSGFYNLSKYYYGVKDYDNARNAVKKCLALSPYNERYWEQLGDIETEKKNTAEAMVAYNNSLQYDPNQYTLINKLRKLEGKPEVYKLFTETDPYKLIAADNAAEAKSTDYGYYYILDEKNAVLYPGGATEEYCTLIIKIVNEKGVDAYKESSIGYNSNQDLLIDKAEVVKKNNSKIEGERNDNQIVFTNLEVGDVVVYKYRLQTYAYGRFQKDFWDKYYLNGRIYSAWTNYNILVPKDENLHYLVTSTDNKPVVTDVENFKKYSWSLLKQEPLKDEPLMPVTADIGSVLHLTTVGSWNEIANWYSDITNNKAEDDYEVQQVYKKIFTEADSKLSEFEKAKKIYNYIEANISYSSVSFRQSNYVPQRPSVTLTTRLGDCKDLSSLFVTLSQMAGIKSQMVLVDTRDNGQKDILLPSIEFNHCITKATLDGKPYYIELTDNHLPFISMPNNLIGAIILEIPYRSVTSNAEIKLLKPENRTKDVVKRFIDIKTEDDNLQVAVKTIKYGRLSSATRGYYSTLDNDKQIIELEKSVASGYKTNVKLSRAQFYDLDKLIDSVVYEYNYKVKDGIDEIGSLKTFKLSYPDAVASLDNFSSDKRNYPIEYWSYEDTDAYETTVNITAPAGKKFAELPQSESFSFRDMKFSIKYTLKAPDKLMVVRTFSGNRQNIDAGEYAAFKAFFEKIVKAEQKFIAFK